MRSFVLEFAWLAICVLGTSSAAQTSSATTSPTAPKVKVELRIGDGTRTTYHIGEVVPVRITFIGTDHANYWIGERCEEYETLPTPIPPQTLATRHRGADGLCANHGWGSMVDITDHPLVRDSDLNWRYRLDSPGTFQMVWTGMTFGNAVATSNTASFTLLPRDPAWDAAELAHADNLLDYPAQATPEKPTENACEELAYLETLDAELDIARRYGHTGCGGDFDRALRNTRNVPVILAALDVSLHRADVPSDTSLLRLLAYLAARQMHPEYYPDDTNWQFEASYGASPRDYKAAHALEESKLEGYERELASILPQKQPDVRAQCIRNLLNISSGFTPTPLPTDVISVIRQQMPVVFHLMNENDRVAVLTNQWDDLGTAEMEPELIGIIDYDGRSTTERMLSLQRLMQLDPARARQNILDEIQSEHPTLPYESLSLLPDIELPQFDSLLLQRASAAVDQAPQSQYPFAGLAFQLLARYASPAIEPQVRSLLNQNFDHLPCTARFQLMVYLHRVDAPVADSFVLRAHFKVPTGVKSPNMSGASEVCTLSEFNTLFWSPAIEAAEIESLDSTDVNTLNSTLRALQQYASMAARPAILKHFQEWNKRWKTLPMPSSHQLTDSDAQLDYAYLYTLTNAFGWRLSPAETDAVSALCLSDFCRNLATSLTSAYLGAFSNISFISYNDLAPYSYGFGAIGGAWDLSSMERKLSQFPNSTQFTLMRVGHRDEPVTKVMQTLGVWMSAHGYTLTPGPPQ